VDRAEANVSTAHEETGAARRGYEASDTATEEEKREAGRQIMKNRGLTRCVTHIYLCICIYRVNPQYISREYTS